MVQRISLLFFICVPASLWAHDPQTVVYGKYYHTTDTDALDKVDNSYYLYRPPVTIGNSPVLFQVYGDGWAKPKPPLTGPFTKSNPAVTDYTKRGIAFVSVGYRAISNTYWFDDPSGARKMEEFIHVDSNGRLSLDQTGMTMADFKAKTCWLELITKAIYDTVQALEHLITNANKYGLDVHRLWFQGSSAGVPEISYLTWVYHRWNVERYTPVGMFMENPIFRLPQSCVMGPGGQDVIQMFIDHSDTGADLPAISLIGNQCGDALANDKCTPAKYGMLGGLSKDIKEAEICNRTWHNEIVTRFCTTDATPIPTLTLRDMLQAQILMNKDSPLDAGLQKLFQVGQNMEEYQPPRPFHVYAVSYDKAWLHGNAFFYAEHAAKLGMNFTLYYLDFPGVRKSNVSNFVGAPLVGLGQLLMRSSISWHSIYNATPPCAQERANYMCYVLELSCSPARPQASLVQQYARKFGHSEELARQRTTTREISNFLPKLAIVAGVVGMLSCAVFQYASRERVNEHIPEIEAARLLTSEFES